MVTLVEVGFLAIGEMSLFESVAHSLTTMSTGGFGTEGASLGAFDAYSQWVVIAFMAPPTNQPTSATAPGSTRRPCPPSGRR